MRNLLEHPILLKEVIDCLETIKGELNPELVGDMRPTIIAAAIGIINTWANGERDKAISAILREHPPT